MKIIISKLSLYLDLGNKNHKQKLLWIYKCFCMKIINDHEHQAYGKNYSGYANFGTFP